MKDGIAKLLELKQQRIAELEKRLEIDESGLWDGIACRDESIDVLDKMVDDLRGKLTAQDHLLKYLHWKVKDLEEKLGNKENSDGA